LVACAAVGSAGGVAFDVFPVINTLDFFPPLCCTGSTGATGAGGGASGVTSFSGDGWGDSIPGGPDVSGDEGEDGGVSALLVLLVLTAVLCFSSCSSCSSCSFGPPLSSPGRSQLVLPLSSCS